MSSRKGDKGHGVESRKDSYKAGIDVQAHKEGVAAVTEDIREKIKVGTAVWLGKVPWRLPAR